MSANSLHTGDLTPPQTEVQRQYYTEIAGQIQDYALVFFDHFKDTEPIERRAARERCVRSMYAFMCERPEIILDLRSTRTQLEAELVSQGIPDEKAKKEAILFVDNITCLIQVDAAEQQRNKLDVSKGRKTTWSAIAGLLSGKGR